MSAPQPPDEARRLETLHSYGVLDTLPEQAFDDLTLLAAQICQVPLAQISLVDADRQWFKSKLGLDAPETPRGIAFCAHTIMHADEVMEISDAQADPRFADNPLVTGDPHIRFYAGAPLVAPDGQALGALCVMDRVPHVLVAGQLAALRALSRHVVAQLELRRQARELVVKEQEAARMLALAEKSRRALLSVLEDEKLAAENLRESESRFRQVVESIREVFWMSDIEKSRIIYISPGYESIWGRSCAELYGSMDSWVQSIQPEDRERVLLAATTKQITGSYDETYRIVRPDGSVRWIHDRAFPVREVDGKVRRVVGVAEDITERKQLEDQFLHAQRMEAIGTLASGIAHDLNNILAPMLMAAGLLKHKLGDQRDRDILAMVETGAQRGASVIGQLLTFGRGIAGARVAVQARHLIKEMAHIVQETFPRNIELREAVPAGLWTVLADATQLHQVFLNLCVNARDAMPEGGRLTIEGKNRRLTAGEAQAYPLAKSGAYVCVTVADTGTGIPPEIINRIFDPFFTTKGLGKGTGLGLSTVMGIVKSHGGFLTVESTPRRGTAFGVYLPATVESVAAPVAPVVALPLGGGELVVVVDDEASIRESVRLLLEKHHYRVLMAGTGEEAVQIVGQQGGAVRLVLTDVMMPGMGGVALIRALRLLQPGLGVMVCSGLEYEDQTGELATLGVTKILAKPFTPEQLLQEVARALAATP